jgi:RND family efflux transporter MFP subunit
LAITRPSDIRDLKFDVMGTLGEVPIKDGQEVEAKQLLAALNLSVDEATLKTLESAAGYAKLQIEAREKDRDAKLVEYQRQQKIWNSADKIKATSESDFLRAKVEYEVAEVGVRLAEQQAEGEAFKVVEHKAKMETKRLRSPITGVVDKVDVDPGETTDAQKPAITVVQNDPLWVELNLASGKAKGLRTGQTLQVRYLDEDNWQAGKIIFLRPVIDATSDTQLVRLEVPNPKDASGYRRESGLQVWVRLPEKPAATAANR